MVDIKRRGENVQCATDGVLHEGALAVMQIYQYGILQRFHRGLRTAYQYMGAL